MRNYILSIDQSTQSTKVFLFGEDGSCLKKITAVHKQYYPKDGWVEQDGEEIYQLACGALHQALSETNVDPAQIAALSITTQTDAFVVWDKKTGIPVYHIIGWQCNRGEEIVKRLSPQQAEAIKQKTMSPPQGYLVAAKLCWMLENIPGLRQKAQAGDVLFGTIESYLIYRFTGGRVHASDYGNAGYTQLLNMQTLCWDKELLAYFSIPENILPQLKATDGDFGLLQVPGLPEVPITGVIGDSAAALFAQGGFEKGSVKVTYGTGASILMNVGDCASPPPPSVLPAVGWKMKNGETAYLWEGTAMYVGDVIQWLVNDLQMLSDAASSEAQARKVDNNGGVYLVPAFNGINAPLPYPEARTILTGMSRSTTKSHIVRAALESAAYQIRDFACAMSEKSGCRIAQLLADGGVTKNSLLMQFQADILNIPLIRSQQEDSSAFGAACIAGLTTGVYQNYDQIRRLQQSPDTFLPQMEAQTRKKLVSGWEAAVRQAICR